MLLAPFTGEVFIVCASAFAAGRVSLYAAGYVLVVGKDWFTARLFEAATQVFCCSFQYV